jgi:hypothetical protein
VSLSREVSRWFICLAAIACGCDREQSALTSRGSGLQTQPSRTNDSSQTDAANQPLAQSIDSVRAGDWFEDVTPRSGIRFTHRNGREAGKYYLIESFGGGVALLDFDHDGDIDLFFTGGGTISGEAAPRIAGLPAALYRNEADWRFSDATQPALPAAPIDFSQGCAVSDFNVDGFPDLLVCCYGRSRLYCNQGDGSFSEAGSGTSLPAHGWGTAAAFGDFDRDGFPDLLLARYTEWSPETDVPCYNPEGIRDLCGPTAYAPTICQFFRNTGDGAFEDWSERVGLLGNVRGLGVVAGDFNADGWVDFYVASDESPKQLYLSGPNQRFTESAGAAGVAVSEWGQPEGSMGVDVGDYNGDGHPDLWVTNFENEDNSLYRGVADGLYMHATVSAGLGGVSRANSGFGTALADLDSDGWLDIFVFNGNPIYQIAQSPFKQLPQLFRNLQGSRFENVSQQGGAFFREVHSGRGSAVGDLDGDGSLDLVAVPLNDPVRLQKNRMTPANYVRVELRARFGEIEATGARITADFAGRTLTRFVVRGSGFFSQSDARFILPVAPGADTAEVSVEWPGRAREVFRGLAVRSSHRLIEGRGEPPHESR